MNRDTRQEILDTFFWKNGPCCAGCDWWRSVNSVVGECRRSAPSSAGNRFAMIGIQGASMDPGAGFVMTMREQHCGEFLDTFKWSSLPASYLRRIGAGESGR
jgi:hypothetical protein